MIERGKERKKREKRETSWTNKSKIHHFIYGPMHFSESDSSPSCQDITTALGHEKREKKERD